MQVIPKGYFCWHCISQAFNRYLESPSQRILLNLIFSSVINISYLGFSVVMASCPWVYWVSFSSLSYLCKHTETMKQRIFFFAVNYCDFTTASKTVRMDLKSSCSQRTSLCSQYHFPPATAPEGSRWERRIGPPEWERLSSHPPWSPISLQSLFLKDRTETAGLKHRQHLKLTTTTVKSSDLWFLPIKQKSNKISFLVFLLFRNKV